jgi:3' terminal RNA ribose 2'-O-methyltransferase Hen1
MLLTLTTTHSPATDLGYLLHKNPAKLHSFELSFGKAHVFYPEATAERCTAALLLDVDPVALVRGKRGQHEGGTLDQYVNDRPYVLSSFLSVAMGRAFGTAMSGRSKGRQELADQAMPLTATLTVVSCRAGASRTIRQIRQISRFSTAYSTAVNSLSLQSTPSTASGASGPS